VAAFDRYVRVTEARMGGDAPFLWVETLPEAHRQAKLQAMRRFTGRTSGVKVSESLGMPVTNGLMIHPNPKGMSRVREIATQRLIRCATCDTMT
jgi:hypothetical protein